MKFVRPEGHSNDLSAWLGERRQTPVLSSVLIEVELVRATRRAAPERLERAAEVLRGIGIVTLSASVVARACAYGDPTLRSLDDGRLLAAAADLGLPIFAPGSSSLGG